MLRNCKQKRKFWMPSCHLDPEGLLQTNAIGHRLLAALPVPLRRTTSSLDFCIFLNARMSRSNLAIATSDHAGLGRKHWKHVSLAAATGWKARTVPSKHRPPFVRQRSGAPRQCLDLADMQKNQRNSKTKRQEDKNAQRFLLRNAQVKASRIAVRPRARKRRKISPHL